MLSLGLLPQAWPGGMTPCGPVCDAAPAPPSLTRTYGDLGRFVGEKVRPRGRR